jgi:cytochrome c peroxidase
MAALDFYQLALPVPAPRPGTFDPTAATRGQTAFNGKARCSTCHVPPLFTEAGWNTHKGSEIRFDDFSRIAHPIAATAKRRPRTDLAREEASSRCRFRTS